MWGATNFSRKPFTTNQIKSDSLSLSLSLYLSLYLFQTVWDKKISGGGSVGRAVASNSGGPRFDISHQQIFILNIYCQLYWKDEHKEREAGNGPLKIAFFENYYSVDMEAFWLANQWCDQMTGLCLQFWPFLTIKLCRKAYFLSK